MVTTGIKWWLITWLILILCVLQIDAMEPENKDTKDLVSVANLPHHVWYKILEILGPDDVISPFARTNEKIYQIIQDYLRQLTDNDDKMVNLVSFLQLNLMEKTTIKVMSEYWKDDLESIVHNRFLFLWKKLKHHSNLELLQKKFTLHNDRITLKIGIQNNHKIDRIPGLPMFYYFYFPTSGIDLWFRVDDMTHFNFHDLYHIEFCQKYEFQPKNNVIIKLFKTKSENAYKINFNFVNNNESENYNPHNVYADVSNTMAIFMKKK